MSWIKDVAESIRRRANMNATIRELHQLSDGELKDVGIPRGQIEEVARGIITNWDLLQRKINVKWQNLVLK
jgi:uncharacterized protein YjiS (DUF1127 family)